MASQGHSSTKKVRGVKTSWGTTSTIFMIMIVAASVATVFTFWTEPGLSSFSFTERFAELFAPKPGTPLPRPATQAPNPRLKIGIVSGHWGNDSGAVCDDGLTEAKVNQEVATRVKESLVGQGYDVDLLKEFDPRLEDYRALLLVSIHADSCEYVNDQATGFKVAAAISNNYPEVAERLTACLRNRYESATGLRFHPGSVTADMTSYHAFDEINPETTAAIIEIGFLNLDRKILTKQPDLVASGITRGILCFIRNENISTEEETPTP